MKSQWFGSGPVRLAAAGLAVWALLAGAPWSVASRAAVRADEMAVAEIRAAVLARHNVLRAKHGSPPMALSEALTETAQAWAEEIAQSGTFAHSPRDLRNDAGENIYASFTGEPLAPKTLADAAVMSWYEEVKDYDYGTPVGSSATGHFTQVVWKGSTQLGVGAARGTRTENGREVEFEYVVCQYAPSGNVRGRYADNVLSGPGASTPPPAGPSDAPPAGGGAAPSVSSVTYTEVAGEGQKLGTLTIVTTQTAGDLAVLVNGRQVAPPMGVIARPDKGFVRLKGTRRELNVVKGANTVVFVVDGARSAPASFTF
jgi:uncharacterized protein YkwD